MESVTCYFCKIVTNNKKKNIGPTRQGGFLALKHLSISETIGPTEEEEVDQFYEDINRALTVPGCSQTFLIGDFNAKVSIQLDEAEKIMRPFGIGARNDRGNTLKNFLSQHRLYLMNSFFQKKEHRRWTWISPNEQTKNEIDFILPQNG
ncbi:craniofacial development protein 2-like [Dendroctonus ponderosae]|uniref:craniofacial development protein 2-like n=1 Tax=Dendroctonus ponderosae TaxID=77166 RepID=UPI002035435F|nr:craniofacial development protein 2-like [Dendroctonus ponderosae]